jgi:cytochrome P450
MSTASALGIPLTRNSIRGYTIVSMDTPTHVPTALVRQFDVRHDERMFTDPFGTFASQHEGPDIFWSPALGGHWVITRMELLRELMQRPQDFSNVPVGLGTARYPRRLIPLEADPPQHGKFRLLGAKVMAPQAIEAMTSNIAEIVHKLVDAVAERGECEFNGAIAHRLPTEVFCNLMGLPYSEADKFLQWNDKLLHSLDEQEAKRAGGEIAEYLARLIEERRREPRTDLVSTLIEGRVDGEPLTSDELLDYCTLFFMAGLDTVAAASGLIFTFLGQHPAHLKSLSDDPTRIPNAVEELLRMHAPVQSNRRVTHDLEFHGVRMKEGDFVLASTSLASLDPKAFANPLTADFDRTPNPHMVFGYGPHRCLGSHLARREINVLLSYWLQRVPAFELVPGTELRYHGLVQGLDRIPLRWDAKAVRPAA